ncbi:MAG: AzlC family ABC transporter permease, partial [Lachnospiraceae bacterium]|nr:AzlC family ABC transporter permease [Lachnospiraceae bacterium]
TYGILMRTAGFPVWLPMLMSLIIYTGSMEFLMTSILLSSFNPVSAFMTALMVGARHIFYGISMLHKYKSMGMKKYYLIFSTSDETFAVNYTAEVDLDTDRGWFYFWVSFLDQMYWFAGAAIGALAGSLIKTNVKGLDFVMTAMFIVIFMNQWVKDKSHKSALIGILGSLIALIIFGPDRFMIPAMIIILSCLLIFRKQIDERSSEDDKERAAGDTGGR